VCVFVYGDLSPPIVGRVQLLAFGALLTLNLTAKSTIVIGVEAINPNDLFILTTISALFGNISVQPDSGEQITTLLFTHITQFLEIKVKGVGLCKT
jgi:hypothetical protein